MIICENEPTDMHFFFFLFIIIIIILLSLLHSQRGLTVADPAMGGPSRPPLTKT